MKPSKAILAGCKIRPQTRIFPFFEGKSCVIGAMLEGAGEKYDDSVAFRSLYTAKVMELFPKLSKVGCSDMNLGPLWRRNDLEKMSREEIAKWLASKGL